MVITRMLLKNYLFSSFDGLYEDLNHGWQITIGTNEGHGPEPIVDSAEQTLWLNRCIPSLLLTSLNWICCWSRPNNGDQMGVKRLINKIIAIEPLVNANVSLSSGIDQSNRRMSVELASGFSTTSSRLGNVFGEGGLDLPSSEGADPKEAQEKRSRMVFYTKDLQQSYII
ncbi:hypothetical protein VNO77_08933 [Canavalia gladiata]|uniref:Uncharacterized protein n=1 Tax=Canavalia gladiata TaxID=3824 RepID=A0AAN9MFG6_CANGL